MGRRIELTDSQLGQAVRLYQSGMSIDAVAQQIGSSYGILRRKLSQVTRLRSRGDPGNRRVEPQYVPTPEELIARRDAIKAGWSERERKKREALGQCGDWVPPVVECVVREGE